MTTPFLISFDMPVKSERKLKHLRIDLKKVNFPDSEIINAAAICFISA